MPWDNVGPLSSCKYRSRQFSPSSRPGSLVHLYHLSKDLLLIATSSSPNSPTISLVPLFVIPPLFVYLVRHCDSCLTFIFWSSPLVFSFFNFCFQPFNINVCTLSTLFILLRLLGTPTLALTSRLRSLVSMPWDNVGPLSSCKYRSRQFSPSSRPGHVFSMV